MPYSQELHRLAEWDTRPDPTISLYLSLDHTREGRLQLFSNLVKQAEQKAKGNGTPPKLGPLGDDLKRAGRVLEELPMGPDRGLVIFSCTNQDRFEVKTLPVLVPDLLEVGPSPYIGPLAALADDYPKTLTVVLDSTGCRIFESQMGQISELSDLPFSGGPAAWESDGNQGRVGDNRIARREEKGRQIQAKEVNQALLDLFMDEGCRQLLVGGAKSSVEAMLSELHPYLAERLAGNFTCDLQCSLSTISQEVNQAQERASREYQAKQLAVLQDNLGPKGQAATGLNQVLAALYEGKVHSLFISRGFKTPGGSCDSCGRLRHTAGDCPICGQEMTPVDDVVNLAVARALDQGAKVEQMQDASTMEDLGNIAALLRYS